VFCKLLPVCKWDRQVAVLTKHPAFLFEGGTMPPEFKRSYRRGYLTDCKIVDQSIHLLIGIPYPGDKWYNYIERRPNAISAVYREMGVHLTHNILIDHKNLSQFISSHRYCVFRLSKPVDSANGSYFLKFINHEMITGYPISIPRITWEPAKTDGITKTEAINFLSTSILSPIYKHLKTFAYLRDIPDGFTIPYIALSQSDITLYKDIITAAFGTHRIMVAELYLRNLLHISEEVILSGRAQINRQKKIEKIDEESVNQLTISEIAESL